MVAAGTDNGKIGAGEVDIIQQFCVSCVVALIYQIGKPCKLVSCFYLIETVNQGGHAGIHLSTVNADAILVLMVGDVLCLSVRIGKR